MVNFVAKYNNVEIKGYVDDDGDYFYYHPLTNQACQDISQIFFGWSEQNPELNDEWRTLASRLDYDEELQEFVDQADDGDTVVIEYKELSFYGDKKKIYYL